MSLQVSPEIEAKIRQVAAARGVPADILFDEALQLGLNRLDRPVVRKLATFKDSSIEMAWVANPDLTYVNQWVALDGNKVVAHGIDGKAVYEFARDQGLTSPFFHFVQEPDNTPFAGGWL